MKRENLLNHNPNLSISTIDVVIPVYNGGKYVIDAIRSVEQQTFKPQRIVVVDDGSTDKTSEVVLNYKSIIPIEYLKKENGGPSSARNAGIKSCTSEYIAFLDADDEWYEDKLKEQINVFTTTNFNNLGVVYCKYIFIDENGDITDKYPVMVDLDSTVRGKVFEKLLEGKPVTGCSSGVLIKRECFDKAGFFDESLRIGEDWDMWIRIAEHYEYDYVDKELVKIRRHGNNTQGNDYYVFSNILIFYNKWIEKLDSKSAANQVCDRIIFKIRKLDFIEAANYVKTANKVLSKTTKRKLFIITFGSLRLYLCIRIIAKLIRKGRNIFFKTS